MHEQSPIRVALVGGGPGSFIGPVHRMAAELDRKLQLVAGAFSRDLDQSRTAGAAWGIDPQRTHADAAALFAHEAARTDGAELVIIATPNASHFALAKGALEAGFHVVCDKPATATLADARRLREIVRQSGRLYALTYTYSGYPMIRQAKALVAAGAIGQVRKVVAEYSQGWLAHAIESEGSRQAAWRTNPAEAGAGGCIGDIGVHAFHLAEFVSGQKVSALCADLSCIVPGRQLDDDCNMLLRFEGGATGVLHASQIATGDRNGLAIRVWGEAGGLAWHHEAPEHLELHRAGAPSQIFHAGQNVGAPMGEMQGAIAPPRLPMGHPQGFIEAFANIYSDVADAIRSGARPTLVPGIDAGVRSMFFVGRAIASSEQRCWLPLEEELL